MHTSTGHISLCAAFACTAVGCLSLQQVPALQQ